MSQSALAEAARGVFQTGFAAILELRPERAAPVFVDGRGEPPVISDVSPGEPDCVWRAPDDVMARVLKSRRAIESAMINGRLVISGDMSVMARLEMSAS